jgi:single-strand DNA-binding protein
LSTASGSTARPPTGRWCASFGPQGENIVASLPRGARAIAVGTFRTRTWRGDDGGERFRREIVADEVGPSLRWATAQITKTAARG